MRKCYFLLSVLGVCLLMLSAQSAKAMQAAGSTLTYANIGPNLYFVQYTFYRDCSGYAAATTETLRYNAPGCATAGTLTLQRNSQTVGNPYCSSVPVTCNSVNSAAPNHEEHVYSGVVSLPQACPNWTFSVRTAFRNNSRNLINGNTQWLYTEAFLNSVAAPDNSSPQFIENIKPYLLVNRKHRILYRAADADGDSIIYSLTSALTDTNTAVSYFSGFSATTPFGPNANPDVSLNAASGMVEVMPTDFNATVTILAGLNKYVVAVQADEYRNINNQWVKIGHVRHDAVYMVIDGVADQLPYLGQLLFNGNPVQYDSVLEVEVGQTLRLQTSAQDPNAGDTLYLSTNFEQLVPVTSGSPGYSFSVSAGARPTATLTWTPTQSHVRDRPYYFEFKVQENACPLKAYYYETVGIRVKAAGATTGVKEDLAKKYKLQTLLTPNGDGIQDRLILAPELEGAALQIYSRDGRLIKSYHRYDNSWAATDAGAGLYFYQLSHTQSNQVITGKILVVK
ncbi:MAG: gliding motility-associated C-terminal domain-containing protein [Hymenobacteraceae bacterium]|nr:gliding motility-associated C-terminal domain-containing protein [Hymenobacteraceae bacterium]